MGVVVTRLGTEIDDCEDTTGWSGGTANSTFNLQGTNCLGEKVSNTLGSENMYTFPGANPDMTTKFIVIPMLITGKADTIANGGYRILAEDGNTDRGTWYVGGDDTTNEKWTYFTVDPSTVPTLMNGSANSAITITSITSSGTTATCTATAHGLATGDYAVIDGVSSAEYNGSFSVTNTGANTFDYTIVDSADDAPTTSSATLFKGLDFTDVDKVGVQMKTVTASLGNNANTFWDVCWYGSGLYVESTIDSVTITRSGSTVTVADTGHGLLAGQTVRISGAVQTDYNGDHVITLANANDYDYEISTTPTSPATGTILSRVHATWDDVADADATGFWGVCVKSQGAYILQGEVVLGTPNNEGAGDLLFVDSNFVCIFRENAFLPPLNNNFNWSKDVSGDNIEVELSDGYVTGNNTSYAVGPRVGTLAVDSVQMTGMTFDGYYAIVMTSDSTHVWDSCKFNNGEIVLPYDATMVDCVIGNTVDDSYGLWLLTLNEPNITNITFKNIGTDGVSVAILAFPADHEMEFDNWDFQDDTQTDILLAASLAAPQTLTSLTSVGTTATATFNSHGLSIGDWVEILGAVESAYNGFFKLTGAATNTFTYTMASDPSSPATGSPTWEEALSLSLTNGSNASTYANSPGGAIDFVSSVPIKVTVLDDSDDTAIEFAHVQIYLTSDYSTEVISGATNASGVISSTWGGGTGINVEGWVRNVDFVGDDYRPENINTTISATGFDITVKLTPTS